MINIPKIRLIDAKSNPDEFVSSVTISCGRYGEFTGFAFLHPADYERYSRFLGCEYAEKRAMIKLYKVMRADCLQKAKTLEDFYKSIKDMNSFDYFEPSVIKLRKEIKKTKEDADILKGYILDTENWIQDSIEAHDKAFNKIEKSLKRGQKATIKE